MSLATLTPILTGSVIAAFLLLCLAIPLGSIFQMAALGSGLKLLFDPLILAITGATTQQALLSTVISATIGLPVGLWLGSVIQRSRTAKMGQALLAFPFGVPTMVVATVLAALLGQTGWLYSLKAVVLAHVMLNAPWMALLMSQARASVSSDELAAARTLGAGPLARFQNLVWPSIRLSFFTGCAQVFSLCCMSFAIVLLLGGGPPVETLETTIYSRVRFSALDLQGALGCALWQLLIVMIPWALVLSFHRKSESLRGSWVSRLPFEASPRRVELIVLLLICTIPVLPYLILFLPSGGADAGGIWSLIFHSAFWKELQGPFLISMELAVSATLLSMLVAGSGIHVASQAPRVGRWVVLLMSLPSGISMLVLGLGFWLAYGEFIDPFEGSLLSMILLQATLFTPIAFRSLWPLARRLRRSGMDAARTLGASSFQAFFRVEWPRWKMPIVTTAALILGASLGEVAAVSLFYSEELVPLPLLLTRWMSQYQFEQAQGLAALLLVLSGGVMSGAGIVGGLLGRRES